MLLFFGASVAFAQVEFPNGLSAYNYVSSYNYSAGTVFYTLSESPTGCDPADGQARSQFGLYSVDGVSWSYYGGGGFSACIGDTFPSMQAGPGQLALPNGTGYYVGAVGNNFTGGSWTDPLNMFNVRYLMFYYDAGTNDVVLQEPLIGLALPPVSPLTFNTAFTNATALGVSSTTVSVDVSYILDTLEYTPGNRPDYIKITTLADGFFSDQQVGSNNGLILPLTDGPHTKNIPLDYVINDGGFPDGDYISFINFWNLNNNSITFGETNIILEFVISGGVVISSTVQEITDGTIPIPETEYQDCSVTNIAGCFQNVFIYTLVPEADAFDKFTTVYEQIENKPPFGYVTAVKNALSGITGNTTPAFAFGDIPFQTDIFDPFKGILAIGLWVLYALFFMGRVNKLDI